MVSNADHTGDETLPNYSSITPKDLKAGMTAYVATDRMNLRSSAEVKDDNIIGNLDINDKVQVVSPAIINKQFVAVKVLQSRLLSQQLDASQTYYAAAKLLNNKPILNADATPAVANKLFVVTNVATEKVRVYRQCEPSEGCVNKMIFEQDVVNGEDKDGTMTDVGHYRIVSWDKFYETPGVYPSWYKPGYPDVPAPGASMSSWLDAKVMPNGQGAMRGAFGWYTLKVGPNPNGQWMHGTAGWGKDKKKFIMFKETLRGAIASLFASIRSHGCTRIDNESIAYLRSLLPIGTTYVKIYAKEGYRDASRRGYSQQPQQWPYIMTKNGGGKLNNHQLADKEKVLAEGTPQSEWIEQGVYSVDQYPDAVAFDSRQQRAKGGDLYKIGGNNFKGVFLVDEGTVVDYQHPSQLGVGGYPDRKLPNVMYSNDRNYTVPEAPVYNNGGDMYPGGGG
jgi:hypothetical protein